jgi:hypothetical protein
MTGFEKVGVLLIVLGVLYALLYYMRLLNYMWLRRSRKDPPAAGRLSGTAAVPAAGPVAGPERPSAAGQPRPLAWVEGTYVGTTMASSRHERVAAAKLAGVRSQVEAGSIQDGTP